MAHPLSKSNAWLSTDGNDFRSFRPDFFPYTLFRFVFPTNLPCSTVLVRPDFGLHHPDAPPSSLGSGCVWVSFHWTGLDAASPEVRKRARPW